MAMPRADVIRPLLAAAVLLALSPLTASADTALPPNDTLAPGGVSALKVAGKSAGDAKTTPVDAADAPGGKAVRVEVRKRANSDYEIQYTLPAKSVDLKAGDVVWASVWARMIDTKDESGAGLLGLVVEQNKEPFNKLIQRGVSVGKAWQQLAAPAKLTKDYAAGTVHLTLRVGGAAQTLELADPQFVKFDNPKSVNLDTLPQTRLTYGGRDASAAWRKAADERIEQLRKAPLVVRVVDAAGKPVSGANVAVEMKRHAFPFGSCYNVSEIVGDNSTTANGKKYQDTFAELFNVGVDEYAMKWVGWETPATQQKALAALKWMDDRNIRVRGHTLVWPGLTRMPADIKSLLSDKAALSKRIDDHVRHTAGELAGRVTEWDVVNEPYVNHVLMDVLGDEAMAHWFKVAHEADANATLFLNETSVPTSPPGDQHYDVLFDQVKMIQQQGGPIGGVGMQAHFGSNLTAITDLQKIYDRFATLNVPLQITELDINVTDEKLQADYLRDFMTVTFAHPNSSGVMIWGFWSKQHWRPDAALFGADWKIRPVGQAWVDLVKKTWWTTATLATGTDGTASVRGFLGDYTVTVTKDGKTTAVPISLAKDAKPVDVVLK